MKVMITIGEKRENKTHLAVELMDKTTIERVKTLISTRRYPEAISTILAKGKSIKELAEKELAQVTSDLMLTDASAYWNLL